MKDKLLLHVCCAPCSSAIIEHLVPYYDITLYFYNPNITDIDEYEVRVKELANFIAEAGYSDIVNIVYGNYNTSDFYKFAIGLQSDHEGGNRCRSCYAQRLSETAKYASKHGFSQFATTLTISPYKDSAVINAIGTRVSAKYKNVMYMPFDFGFLYTRSLELCNQFDLYQQDYCGCEYSKSSGGIN